MNKSVVAAIIAIAVLVTFVITLLVVKVVEGGDGPEPEKSEPVPRLVDPKPTTTTTKPPTTTSPPVSSNEDLYEAEARVILPGSTRQSRLEVGYESCELIDLYYGDFESLTWDLSMEATIQGASDAEIEAIGGIIAISTIHLCPEWYDELERWLATGNY